MHLGSPTWARTTDLAVNSRSLIPTELSGNDCILAEELLEEKFLYRIRSITFALYKTPGNLALFPINEYLMITACEGMGTGREKFL